MSRPKLNKASPHFMSRGHPLRDSARAKLVQLLGSRVDENFGDVIRDVEMALGIYVDGAKHIDNPPRPTHYVREFESLQRKARMLSETLFEISYYYERELSVRGVDCNNIAAELLKLAGASTEVIEQFRGQSSKGARKKTALLETIRHLKKIFRDSYQAPRTNYAKRRREFIRVALEDTRCISASMDDSTLLRLIRDARAGLPEDRKAIFERIARREHIARQAGKRSAAYTMPEPDPARGKRAVAGAGLTPNETASLRRHSKPRTKPRVRAGKQNRNAR